MMPLGDILSTMRDVQYCGGYHDKCGGYLEHHWVFSTMGNIMSTVGIILSTVGGYSVPWGNHDARY